MRVGSRVISIALLLAEVVFAAHAQPRHRVTLADLETLRAADYLQLSPDGEMLTYSAGETLWLVATHPASVPRKVAEGFLPIWSPNSRQLAFYSFKSGKVQLWVLNIATGHAEQITHLPGGVDPDPKTLFYLQHGPFAYSWSPDSARLVFASRVPEVGHEIASNIDPNATQRASAKVGPLVLTAGTPSEWTLSGIFCEFGDLRYKDGQLTFDVGPRSGKRPPRMWNQLFVADVRRKTTRQLTEGDRTYFNPDWSPDGKRIVCAWSQDQSMPYASGTTNIYVIDLESGQKTAVTNGSTSKWMPRWSPDGKAIAYWERKGLAGAQSVFVITGTYGEPVQVASQLDRYVMDFQWSPDSKSIVIDYPDGVSWIVARFNLQTCNIERLSGNENAVRFLLTIARSGLIAWQQTDPTHYGVIRLMWPGEMSSRVLVDLNPQIQDWDLGEQEVVRWKNHRGDDMEGVLIKPVGYKEGRRYPLIVDGYPGQADNFKGSAITGNQAWASEGYAVFWPNARAPHDQVGRFKSEAYDHAANGPKGWQVTVDDVMSGVDELIRRGIADRDRMGLYGFSNGGGVVNYLVTTTSRFKCAVSVAGALSDWVRPALLDPDSWIRSVEEGLDPWNELDALVGLSAVFRLNKVTTPMLLADGDRDGNFLLDNIEMYNGLRHFNQDVVLLRYPQQGHGFTGGALKDFWSREMVFFNHYLRPDQRVN